MIARRIVCLTALICVIWNAAATAQTYRFQVEEMELQVYLLPDASARLDYTIVFLNQQGASPIDIVDVGLPHSDYQLQNMSAAVDGVPVSGIQPSTYIDVGVEVPLGGQAIAPGERGVFTFRARLPDMVYRDTTDADRAAFQIRPTWFDPSLQLGTTHLKIAIHLPAGVEPEEVTWHDDDLRYQKLVEVTDDGPPHVAALWSFPEARLSPRNPKVGISFPRSVMSRVVEIGPFGLLVKWFRENKHVQQLSGAILLTILAVTFLRFTHGTGLTLLVILVGLVAWMMYMSPVLHLLLWIPIPLLLVLNEWALLRRKTKYLPAMATVEGGGIKRGLTAPEAAVLLELPLGKILALVIFGMLKKGLLTMVEAEPLRVSVPPEFCVARTLRRKRAAEKGIVLHGYEQSFLDRLMNNEQPVEKVGLSEAMGELVKSTADRMKGFDLSDTQDYYRAIIRRAWAEAESIGEIEQRQEVASKNEEWMMMDPDWGRRMDRWGRGGYGYRPVWMYPGGSSGRTLSTPSTPAPSGGSGTSFGEVAGSFAGWAENAAGRFASAVEPAAMGLSTKGGLIDLSSVDRVTGEMFAAMAESGGSGGGGGGGGCACACAGCACACACAGGGR